MKLEFVPKFIMLLAGAVVSITAIINDLDVTYSLELLLATLIIFYIIGLITKKIIQKVMESNMFIKQQAEDMEMENIDIPTQDWVEGVSDTNMENVSGGPDE